ncbi:hypothetical protein JXA88_18060 [Candidatus Fermentibacteria bacterium]|nr:hypothetical protein [Candidatus Fermentibacteria bacterium]
MRTCGVAFPGMVHGLDLRLLARGKRGPAHEVILAESVSRRVCAAWEDSMKLIWVPGAKATDWTMPKRVMLFDLAADPAESRNVLKGNEMLAARLRDLWAEGVHNPPVRLEPWSGMTDTQKLKALAYLQ